MPINPNEAPEGFRAVPGDRCHNCAFNLESACSRPDVPCTPGARQDGVSVFFIPAPDAPKPEALEAIMAAVESNALVMIDGVPYPALDILNLSLGYATENQRASVAVFLGLQALQAAERQLVAVHSAVEGHHASNLCDSASLKRVSDHSLETLDFLRATSRSLEDLK